MSETYAGAASPAAMADPAWQEANRRYLAAALDRMHSLLEEARRGGEGAGRPGAGQDPGGALPLLPDASELGFPGGSEGGSPEAEGPALESLASRFGLGDFESGLILLLLLAELAPDFPALAAPIQGDERPYPTFALAAEVLPDADFGCLAPGAPLRRWQLVELGSPRSAGLAAAPLRLAEPVIHYLQGRPTLDPRLRGTVEVLPSLMPPGGAFPAPFLLPPSQRAAAQTLAEGWWQGPAEVPVLGGDDTGAGREVFAAACTALGLAPLRLPAEALPASAVELEALARLVERDATLLRAAFLVEVGEVSAPGEDGAVRTAAAGAARRFVELCSVLLAVAASEARAFDGLPGRTAALLTVDRPTAAEQAALWGELLGKEEDGAGREALAGRLAAYFDLPVGGIRAAAAAAVDRARRDGVETAAAAWEAARAQARPALDGLARRVRPAARRADLVLPPGESEMLGQILIHARRRARVHEEWGFAARSSRGMGLAVLLAGPSGTGKTMTAEVLAAELDLDLYRVDLASVVSKYIGETEKNLKRVFDAGEAGGAVLLFDEADALFGKRSEVRDSHDRYANVEVGYLLQRIEAYRGLAVLTTNLKDSLDPAFLRRLRFVLQFPFPDEALRRRIWARAFPPETPVGRLDLPRLARLVLSGGSIRNVALAAAFLAAEEGTAVEMAHVLEAARHEHAKIGRPWNDGPGTAAERLPAGAGSVREGA